MGIIALNVQKKERHKPTNRERVISSVEGSDDDTREER